MKTYANIFGVVLVGLAIQLTLAGVENGPGDDLISRPFTVTSNIDSIVSRAFTVTSNTDTLVSRAFTVTSNTGSLVSRAFTVTSNIDSLVSRAFTVVNIDCNTNGVPDQCDVDCGLPGCDIQDCGQSDDCNDNDYPDECDITAGISQDCNSNGIPDECELPQSGAVSTTWSAPSGGSWFESANWCLPEVPDNNQNADFDVIIDTAGAIVTLDGSPSIGTSPGGTSLSLTAGATVVVGDASGADVRSLLAVGTMLNQGTFRATDRERLVLDAPVIDQGGVVCAGGMLEATDGVLGPGEENDRSILQINGSQVLGGTLGTEGDDSEIQLTGGAELVDVCLLGLIIPDGQTGRFSGTITNDGVLAVAGETVPTFLQPTTLDAVLDGTGSVLLTDESNAWLGDSVWTFTNAPTHRIEGTGVVFGGVTNEGTIEANDPDGALILFQPGVKANSGVLRATAGGVLRIDTALSQSAGGVIEATAGGIVEIDASVSGSGSLQVHCPTGLRGGCTPPPRGTIGGAGSDRPMSLNWEEQVPGGLRESRRALSLELPEMSKGTYLLRLQVNAYGREPVVASRELIVKD